LQGNKAHLLSLRKHWQIYRGDSLCPQIGIVKPSFSASLLTLHVLPISRPLLITDTHRQARGDADRRFGGLRRALGKPHNLKTGGSRYAPSFDRLDIGVSFFGFDLRSQVFG
jgi:hypothetical protein